jgi:anaerobic dimethyl sulfoxide reductase subunit C (anchor subunit)
MSEWPLIVFTLALQFACGLALAATLCDRNATPAPDAMRPLALSIFPLAVLGLLASLFHLGRPISAWKSLLNLGSSRLSLEVLFSLLFVAAAFIYAHAWWTHRAEHRLAIGVVTSLLALAAVASSAAIYLIPTQPAWNSGWVPVSFLGTALLLGGAASAAFLNLEGARSLYDSFLAGVVVGSLMLIVAAIWMVVTLSQGSSDGFASARLQDAFHVLTSQYAAWFGLYLLLAGIVPIVLAALLWMGRNNAGAWSALGPLVLLAIFLGTIIGRRLMYLLVTSQSQF